MNKLYVLVRGDLSPAQQAVQACHALAEFMLEYKHNPPWHNETLVLLKVRDKDVLGEWLIKLCDSEATISSFCEPDLNGELTAIAAHGQDLPKMLKKLSLV